MSATVDVPERARLVDLAVSQVVSDDCAPQHLDPLSLSAQAIYRTTANFRHASAAAAGVTHTELCAMGFVAENEDISPSTLAELLMLTPGAVTAITNGLVESGRMTRREHPADRRRVVLGLTEFGDRTMRQIYESYEIAIAAATAHLTPLDRRRMADAMVAMATAIDNA